MRRQDFVGNKLDFAIGGTLLFVIVGLLMARSTPRAAASQMPLVQITAAPHSSPAQQSVWQGYQAENTPTSPLTPDYQGEVKASATQAAAAPTQPAPAQPPAAIDTTPGPLAIIVMGNGDGYGNYTPDSGQTGFQLDALGNPVGFSVAYPMDDGTYIIERYQSNQSYGPTYQPPQGGNGGGQYGFQPSQGNTLPDSGY